MQHTGLKRGIGPRLLLLFILGDILGAGIYVLVGEVGAVTGGAIWSAFLVALLLAVFTAASYAELATKYPRAGGAATYVNQAFRRPFVSFMVAFAVAASGLTSASTLSVAFGGDYLKQFVGVPTVAAALALVVVLALINFYGISESVKLNAGFTTIEAFGLLLIVLIGAVALFTGTGDPGRAFEFKGGTSVPLAILAGVALSFYAMIGFEDSANVAEEIQDPSRNYPRGLFGGVLVAGVIYLLVTFTASMVVPTSQLAGSSAPLLEVVERGPLSIPTTVFAAIALFAVSNSALINLIMASRIIYGMGAEGVMPAAFARVHPARRTPWMAIFFTTLVVFLILLTIGGRPNALDTLASTTVVLLLLAFVMVNISVLVLRGDRVEHTHFRAPTALPVFGVLIALAFLIYTAVSDIAVFALAALLLTLGIVLWVVNVLVKRKMDQGSSATAAGEQDARP